jgi:preprotein translocase subunit SecE
MNFSERWTTFRGFLSDVKKETSKVSWPDRDEVVGTTMVVIVYTILVGIFLFLVDAAVTPLVNKLFSAFGG